MAAASSIILFKDINRKFYSTYRPIEILAYCPDGDIAYLQGELLIESGYDSGVFVSTGAICNGFANFNIPGAYDFNLMEYCRNYTGVGTSPITAWSTFMTQGYVETNRFKFEIWAVRYSATAVGQTYDDHDTTIQTRSFVATPANLHNNISTGMSGNSNVDQYVLGDYMHGANVSAPAARPLTLMPRRKNRDHQKPYMINMNDQAGDSIYSYWSPGKFSPRLYVIICGFDAGDDVMTWAKIFELKHPEMMVRLPLHPKTLTNYISMMTGSAFNDIIDASGNLVCKKISYIMLSGLSGFNPANFWAHQNQSGVYIADWRFAFYTDEDINNGACNRIKFVFQNSLGGFDWFSCYGTQSKKVGISGKQYDKSSNQYGASSRELHSRTWLTTEREDIFRVVSSAMSKSEADYLIELYASSKVWIQEEYEHVAMNDAQGKYRLVPILLSANSWDLYSTDESVFFLEFEYTYSEKKTNPKG